MSESYRDEILRQIDVFLRESVPPEATDEDRELLAELAAAVNDPKRADTIRPGKVAR